MSPREFIAALQQALSDPRSFFESRPPADSIGFAALTVTVLAVASSLAILAVGFVLDMHIDATMTVTTMEPWPESTCDQFREMNNSTNHSSIPEQCTIDSPRTKQVDIGAKAFSIFAKQLPLVFFGTYFGWLIAAAGLHVVSAFFNSDGPFTETLAVTGIGMFPTVFQTIAAAASMGLTVRSIEFASDSEVLAEQFQAVAFATNHPLVVLVIVAVGIWQAWIWAAGLEHARDLSEGDAKITAALIAIIGMLLAII